VADALKYPTAQALMARASEATGLTDFGPDGFQVGLARLLEGLEGEVNLDPLSEAQILGTINRRLESRLEIADWRRAHPEIATLPVPGMVSIMGLPRTGTTALVNIMSLDDDVRCLRAWEQAKPCPPPIAARARSARTASSTCITGSSSPTRSGPWSASIASWAGNCAPTSASGCRRGMRPIGAARTEAIAIPPKSSD
jgi:hypothetical protein